MFERDRGRDKRDSFFVPHRKTLRDVKGINITLIFNYKHINISLNGSIGRAGDYESQFSGFDSPLLHFLFSSMAVSFGYSERYSL
jgi:hypothetical protein